MPYKIKGVFSSNLETEFSPADKGSLKYPWKTGADMPTGREYLSSCTLGDKIYAIGGVDSSENPKTNVEIYDIITNSWSSASVSLLQAKSDLSSLVIDNKIYVLGGRGVGSGKEVQIFDGLIWSYGTNLSHTGYYMTSSVVNGIIYAIGCEDSDPMMINKVISYNPSTGESVVKPDMPTMRVNTSSSVFNGKIYVFGGKSGSLYQNKVEIYDPTTNIWSSGTNMPTARENLTV
nr:kelch repeat-containing protein [Spirochaetota bacterium]